MPITSHGSTDYTDDLRLAHVLADDADSTSQARFKALDLHVMTKPDLTPVTDADHNLVLHHERDERRPHRHAADVVLGAVDRVDHPAPLAVPGGAQLLAGDRVAGAHPRQRAPDALLHALVGIRDRGEVGLAHHVQVERLEAVRRQGVRVVGQHVREAQVVGVVGGTGVGHEHRLFPGFWFNVHPWRSTEFRCTP